MKFTTVMFMIYSHHEINVIVKLHNQCWSKSQRMIHEYRLYTGETQHNLRTMKCVCHIRYFLVSVAYKQYKTKQFISLGPEKTACEVRYLVISDLFISSFHYSAILNICNANYTTTFQLLAR